METTRDQTRALVYAIGVHVLAAFLMFAGLLFNTTKPTPPAGGAIEAVLVDMNIGHPLPKPASSKPAPKPPAPKPAPEPPKPAEPAKPEPAPPPPPPQAKPDDVTDQRPVLPTVDQEAMNLERQREELRVQQEQLRRQQEVEQQRLQQLEDIRRQREAAARETEQAEQNLADTREAQRASQILNQPAPVEPAPVGSQPQGDASDDLSAQYRSLIQAVVTQNWRRPMNTPPGIVCVVNIRQIIGGEITSATIGTPCNAPANVQQSILDAFERASPLPYDGFESVFRSAMPFEFSYDG